MATLTPEAKQLLARTIRELRARLLRDLHDEADRRYRLSLPIDKAKLAEEPRKKRERLEAWLDERVRTVNPKNAQDVDAARARFLLQAEKEAAATALNRMVLLRHLEALGLSRPAVVTGGWNSMGYRELRDFAPALTGDETLGYATLLQLVFDELALDLPGLFGDVGLVRLFPLPAATLREVVEKLDAPELESAWTDDTTLGWVYQYWNDPEREALDDKIAAGGKIEPHEIASKTQMFTERYMVEWLLHNSLGLTWLCMCKKHGWTADAEAILPVLDARRAEWRKKREAGQVALDALMPIDGELEEHWKYYVPQPIPEDAVPKAPDSVHALKLLDPACGSGHFLVIAFDLLAALYREEARHRGRTITDREIAESILENNLHGIDIDPRAVQIAAAAVVLKAKRLARDAQPKRVNLVAPVLRLGELPKDDPALVRLRHELKSEAGIPEELTQRLIESLAGVDHLGSLLKVDAAIDEAIAAQEQTAKLTPSQGDLLSRRFAPQQAQIDWSTARVTLLERLEAFLARHSGDEDLGLRLDGEQIAAGVRFVRMAKEGTYDIVVGNPPYQGLSKTVAFGYVTNTYPRGKADLYAAFLERGLQLTRSGGVSALLTMRGWMFLGQFTDLRKELLKSNDLRAIGDLDRGAFDEVPNELLAVSITIFRRTLHRGGASVASQPTPLQDKSYDRQRTNRKRAALLAQVGRFEFDPSSLDAIDGEPILYSWSLERLAPLLNRPALGKVFAVKTGLQTSSDTRFLRRPWEVQRDSILGLGEPPSVWAPIVAGAAGKSWMEPLDDVISWSSNGLEVRAFPRSYARNMDAYFAGGVAFSDTGNAFCARAHAHPSIIGDKGPSIVCADADDNSEVLCALNRTDSKLFLEALNPGTDFQVGDVERLPLVRVENASEIFERLRRSFAESESGAERSVEFREPSVSSWTYGQAWAQQSVDRPEGAVLPPYAPEYEPPSATKLVSFALGVVLGRFGAEGEGILKHSPASALPAGILFVSEATDTDSVAHAASAPLHSAWAVHGAALSRADDLRTYLRVSFFKHHKSVYDNRPIYFPLSSAKKNFVAWISVHRWTSGTLLTLLADHLNPKRRSLEGELDDLRKARANVEGTNRAGAERRFAEVQKLLAELTEFIGWVIECAERGPPPTTPTETHRERDARYEMDLDDGVMVNSAALWPLLEPQWKEPKKWWHELAEAKGRKDYDWAHLAKRYFPERVEKKCVDDPSLAVAHGCFWRLHPAKAYAWELRLQDEIRPDFTIDEEGSNEARARWLKEHAREAQDAQAAEKKRRARKAAKAESADEEDKGSLFGGGTGADAEGEGEEVTEE